MNRMDLARHRTTGAKNAHRTMHNCKSVTKNRQNMSGLMGSGGLGTRTACSCSVAVLVYPLSCLDCPL